jgi:hypothetical protein
MPHCPTTQPAPTSTATLSSPLAQVSSYGAPKMGAYRAKFIMEAVADLRASLQGLGSDLVVAVGKPEDVIAGGGQGLGWAVGGVACVAYVLQSGVRAGAGPCSGAASLWTFRLLHALSSTYHDPCPKRCLSLTWTLLGTGSQQACQPSTHPPATHTHPCRPAALSGAGPD